MSQHPPIASIFRRLLALIYDSFLLFGISITYAAGVLGARILFLGQEQALAASSELFQFLQLVGLWVVLSCFYVWCWRRSGQTLGMKVWRLQIQQIDGSRADLLSCWYRCLLAPLSLLTIIGYLWALFHPEGHCLHDLASKTKVVLLPKD